MKTTQYKTAAILLTLGLGIAGAHADSKRINQGRAGYTTVPVTERVSAKTNERASERPVTIGVLIGEERGKKMTRTGGRANVGLRQVR